MQSRTWRAYVAVSAVLALAHVVTPTGVLRDVWYQTVAFGACAAVVVGLAHQPHGRRRPWTVLAVGLGLFATGDLIYALERNAGIPKAALSGADLGYLIGYLLLGLTCHLFVRAQTRGHDPDSLIDSTIVMIALATLLWDLLVTQPIGSASSALTRAVIVAAPLLLAAVTAVCVRLVFVGGRSRSAWLFLLAGLAALSGNVALALVTSPEVLRWVESVWLLAFAACGSAALHGSARQLTRAIGERSSGVPLGRLVILAFALLAGPATLLDGSIDAGLGVPLPVVASFALTMLVIWRLSRLVVERELARAELHARADRQAAVARIGERALEDISLDVLLAEAIELVGRLTGGGPCRFEMAADVADAVIVANGEVRVRVGAADDALGVLVIAADHCSADERSFLQAVASVLAGARQRRRTEEEIRHQALHDPLTGLPNRLLLADRLAQALDRRSATTVCVMFVDLDGFKAVNDEHGHEAGDRLLQGVAARLQGALRADDTLARFAGDEFVVVADVVSDVAARELSERLADVLQAPVPIGNADVVVSASIGVAIADGSDQADDLVRRADAAMYRAKAAGKGRVDHGRPLAAR